MKSLQKHLYFKNKNGKIQFLKNGKTGKPPNFDMNNGCAIIFLYITLIECLLLGKQNHLANWSRWLVVEHEIHSSLMGASG